MKDNGTDRDIALQMVSLLSDINTALTNINDHKFVPHILTQPTDQEGAVGSQVTFTVVANNVKAYQWQFKAGDNVWKNSAGESTAPIKTQTVSTNNYYNYQFRCKITGLDNSVIYTDIVRILEPTPEAEG